jgi:hypothetical protein
LNKKVVDTRKMKTGLNPELIAQGSGVAGLWNLPTISASYQDIKKRFNI